MDASLGARRVFGEPIERDGVIVLPAAKVGGGGGGGGGTSPAGEMRRSEQGGVGFGLSARPAGAFVLDRGRLRWKPAVDVNRVILGGQLVMMTALWTLGALLRGRSGVRQRPRRRWLRLARLAR
jgi:uncharacterized spore protein YtfJ